jgi:hypothetical protein
VKRLIKILQFALVSMIFTAPTNGRTQVIKIREVDFKNFTYAWDNPPTDVPESWHWITSSPHSRITAFNGVHHFYEQGQDEYEHERAPLLSVDSVAYGHLVGDGDEEAVVSLNYSTGGTANWDYIYVYKLRNGRLALLGRMETGSRGSGGLINASVHERSLVVDFADKDRPAGDCCSEGYIRVRYRWQDGSFIEAGARETGDLVLRAGPSGAYRWEETTGDEQSDFSSNDENWNRPAKVPEEVLEVLRTISGASPDELPSEWLLASEIHLDGPIETDLVVMGIRGLRGAHAVPFWIFRRTAESYQLILSTGGDGLRVSQTKWNGYRTIQTFNLTGIAITTASFRFDGHQYTRSSGRTKPIE